MNNVFITMLGTTDYIKCNYVFEDGTVARDTRFIQAAIASTQCMDWTSTDKIVILMTGESFTRNWCDDGITGKNGVPLKRDGLKKILDSLGLRCQIVPISDVPTGSTQAEIWKIFEVILEHIPQDAKVVFDITHGFRSLPLLVMLILDYARVLKQVTIESIFYGAFESLGIKGRVMELESAERNVPVWNFLPFSSLIKWTRALEALLQDGSATRLMELSGKDISSLACGGDEHASRMKEVSYITGIINDLVLDIKQGKACDIIKNENYGEVLEKIEYMKSGVIPPLKPLLSLLENRIHQFKNNDLRNGYVAVEWCIEQGLLQQGFLLLKETLISELIAKHDGQHMINRVATRNFYRGVVNALVHDGDEGWWTVECKDYPGKARKLTRVIPKDVVTLFSMIEESLGILETGGFLEGHGMHVDLKNQLEKCYTVLGITLKGNERVFDIFISHRSPDFESIAKPLHDFLVKNGFRVFLSEITLKDIAKSEFSEVIDTAIDNSRHMIVCASCVENLSSGWVKEEWMLFLNELRSSRKSGNLVVVLDPGVPIGKIPLSLRSRAVIRTDDNWNDDLLPYFR